MELEGLRPAFIDKDGPAYHEADVLKAQANHIDENGVKISAPDLYKRTAKVLDDSSQMLKTASERFMTLERDLSQSTKLACGRVRSAAEDLVNGLAKCEKQANFDRLERYVSLLERAAQAMSTLADLEKSGKLDKISNALK